MVEEIKAAGGDAIAHGADVSNAEQVAKVREVLSGLSLEPASPEEAREILQLKGGDRVGF